MRTHRTSVAALVVLTFACSRPQPSGGADAAPSASAGSSAASLRLSAQGYFEAPGVEVMAFSDFYPENHQGGVTLLLDGRRVAANGDVRLEPAPGQWAPVPVLVERKVDPARPAITSLLRYPDPSRDRKGFNPIEYPDLKLSYHVSVEPEGAAVRVRVDLDAPLPAEWVGKVGYNLEVYPGEYFGKSFTLGGASGIFPRQLNGPMEVDAEGRPQAQAFGEGDRLEIAPESPGHHLTIEGLGHKLRLLDGRAQHDNGWFIVRSELAAGKTRGALEWRITPHPTPGFRRAPVVHVSQVGYHPKQNKQAVIELDPSAERAGVARLERIAPSGARELVLEGKPQDFGHFLRSHYARFDFTSVRAPGIYRVSYGDIQTNVFEIGDDIYSRHVWQPTLEYFLPVQMCHMRVNDRYRVWHGLCHMDDARMAPVSTNHFDGYVQGPSTLTRLKPLEHVPHMDAGGWHDAGDYDLRVESQVDTLRTLAEAWEAFEPRFDATSIDQAARLVELHVPDGTPDVLQQIEHGVLSVLGGYRALGRLYRGVICPTLRQYTLLGDVTNMTDGLAHDPTLKPGERREGRSGVPDDRLVFTEENPQRELGAAAGLAVAGRVLREHRPELAAECVKVAQVLYDAGEKAPGDDVGPARVHAAAELLLTTGETRYESALVAALPEIEAKFEKCGWAAARALPRSKDTKLKDGLRAAATAHARRIEQQGKATPFGVPYAPKIWGAGWDIQRFGVEQYHLRAAFPDLFPAHYVFDALSFILGVHPGTNTASFASGVGARSMTTAYGTNRAEFSYIPGGVVSGTALIRPNFPELLDWPFIWQQGEYMIGVGSAHYIFLVLAAERLAQRG